MQARHTTGLDLGPGMAWPSTHVISMVAMVTMLIMSIVSFQSQASTESSWRFKVLLDGKPVGEHVFTVTVQDGYKQVQSDAQMKVKVLFIDAYTYEHRASEIWQDGCLLSINAQTKNNNRQVEVRGKSDAGKFLVSGSSPSKTELPGCIKSFAYWDQTFLQATRLLNSQTGEMVDVQVRAGELERIQAGGQEWPAQSFELRGEKLHIDLWYGPEGEWLRLSSLLPSGRKVDYLLVERTGWSPL